MEMNSDKKAVTIHSPPFEKGRPAWPRPRVVLIRRRPDPTDEIYFLRPLKHLRKAMDLVVVDTDRLVRGRGVGPEVITPGCYVVISRYIPANWLAKISRIKPHLEKVLYLVDDDIPAARDSKGLPSDYRRRMSRVAKREFQPLLRIADRLVTTSRFMYERYRSPKTDLLEPAYLWGLEDFGHFDGTDQIRISYLGTRSHQADLAAITSALVEIHDAFPMVHFESLMGEHTPRQLKRLQRCTVHKPMKWPDFKRFIHQKRSHIGIAPLLDVPYNRGKSFSKVLDISAVGAAGIYTNSAPYAGVIDHGVNGLLVGNEPEQWKNALLRLIQNPGEMKRMAMAGQELSRRIGSSDRVARYWMEQLSLGRGR